MDKEKENQCVMAMIGFAATFGKFLLGVMVGWLVTVMTEANNPRIVVTGQGWGMDVRVNRSDYQLLLQHTNPEPVPVVEIKGTVKPEPKPNQTTSCYRQSLDSLNLMMYGTK